MSKDSEQTTKKFDGGDPAGPKQGGRTRGLAPCWKPGQSGNPAGRPRGSRNKLGEDFLADVYADWAEHGASVLGEVREKSPAIYLRVVASLVPRHLAIETIGDEFDDMTSEELRQYLAEQAKALGLLDDLPENRNGH